MPLIEFMPTIRHRRHLLALFAFLILALPAFAKTSTEVVVVPVANMYAKPTDQSPVVSQAIYGSNVRLLIAQGEWCKIQTSDRYRGWISSHFLRLIQIGDGYATSGKTVQVQSFFANLYREADLTRHKPTLTVPFESRLELIEEGKGPNEGWLKLRLPDQRIAWIQSGDTVSDPKLLTIPESIDLAKRFLGFPYLWGGRSSFGYDCSGFTQMLVRARGINMPRDADQQAAWTGVVPVDRKDLQPGDLLFFGSSAKKITHTGMYIGDSQFIQATTTDHPAVQISSIDDAPWTKLLVAARRLK